VRETGVDRGIKSFLGCGARVPARALGKREEKKEKGDIAGLPTLLRWRGR